MPRAQGRITSTAERVAASPMQGTMQDPQAKIVMYEPRDFEIHGGIHEHARRQSCETSPLPPSPVPPVEGEPSRVVMELSLLTPNRNVAQFIGMALLRDVFGLVRNNMPDAGFEEFCSHCEVVGHLNT